LIQIWHIYIAMLLRSIGGAFQWPAMLATTSLMVPKRHLSRVAGFNQSLMGLANIIAPPLGALLLELWSVQSILVIDIVTAILAITPLFFISIPQPLKSEVQERGWRSVITEMREGFHYVWSWTGLMMIMAMAMIINLLLNPAFTLLPLLVTNHFQGGALELAWLQSANGVGMVLGGLTLGIWGGTKQRIITALSALILAGLCAIILGLTPVDLFLLAVFSLFGSSFMNALANGIFMATMQAIVPPMIQGRVFTLLHSLSMGMTPIGLAIVGPVADLLGERIWFIIGGIAFILMGISAFTIPSIKYIEDRAKTNN
jgi:DHA3 family macrolide efflux protein-like MFS transporter